MRFWPFPGGKAGLLAYNGFKRSWDWCVSDWRISEVGMNYRECEKCGKKGFFVPGMEICPECGEWMWYVADDPKECEGCLVVLEEAGEQEYTSVRIGKGDWEAQG